MNTLVKAMRRAASALGFGRLMYVLWHAPRAAIARSIRAGGPIEQWNDSRGRAAMQTAAANLPPCPAAPAKAVEVCFLTGKKFWYQTACCCWTLRQHANFDLRPVFIDDGTFDEDLIAESARVFPGSVVLRQDEIERRLEACLPEARFPALRGQRRSYVHLRKITDAHAGHRGWRLVLDSDMLFFRPPTELLQWLAAPDRPVHMMDVHDAYGYPSATLEALTGHPPPMHLNVGVCGLQSDALDWDQLESWCAALLRQHGSSYYLEQALVAMLLSASEPLRLPQKDYLLMPSEAECRAPTAVLHHYVDQSKRGYFRYGWRRALGPITTRS